MPEGKEHLEVRTFLYKLLQYALGPDHTVGSDQFVYWNARAPQRCLSPDAFVCVGVPNTNFASWKTWERGGAPALAVEIISPNEGDGVAWDEKLARYHELGVRELVRFDPQAPEGMRLRAWDRVDEDLVEREVKADTTPCLTLGVDWVVRPLDKAPVGLRLAEASGELVLSELEVEAKARHAAEARASAEATARAAAEARVRELEAELRRRT